MTKPNNKPRIFTILSGQDQSASARVARLMLAVAEPLYAMGVQSRNWLFDVGLRRAHRASHPVISIGNLTTGGTGKTPIVACITRNLLNRGHHPAILLRGYKSAFGVSDEAVLLRRLVAPAIVVANPDRIAGAAEAWRLDSAVDCFILDDGFQHRKLFRSLDVTLIDATEPFGFDHVLPRGLLREPVGGLKRCDCVIITRCENADERLLQSIRDRIRSVAPDVPILECSILLEHFLDQDERVHLLSDADKSYAICGIGNPLNFFAQLRRESGPLLGEKAFPDHHVYTEADFRDVAGHARALSADRIITTEKDWMKLKELPVTNQRDPAVWRAISRVEFSGEDLNRLLQLIESALKTEAD